MEIGNLMHGFAVALTWKNLLFMLVGILLGVLIGVLPGLGGANGVAILLPLTFSMPPTSAIIMLSCIYWGALFGGAITSILFNIPGEPWSVATTFDGYPMAQKGRAGEALTAAFTSSFVGALFAILLITFLAPLVAKFALKFGPPEYFAIQLLTFCSFVGMGREPPVKTIASMMLGFALAAVGLDTVTGTLRMTFGHAAAAGLRLPDRGDRPLRPRRDPAHDGGGPLVQGQEREDRSDDRVEDVEDAAAVLGDVAPRVPHRLLDGHHAGRRDARVVHELRDGAALLEERRQVRRRRDRRRHRARDRGARRRHQRAAADAHARHPRLADRGRAARRPADLGPAARAAAVRRETRVRLGPDRQHVPRQHRRPDHRADDVPWWAAILRIPFSIIAPVIVVICAIGAYTVHNNMFDVVMMVVFGVVGYVFKKLKYPLAPLVLALVLGDMAETAFRQSMLLSRRDRDFLVEPARGLDRDARAAAALLAAPVARHHVDAREADAPARRRRQLKRSRSTFFCTLPIALRGSSSTKMHALRHLERRRSRLSARDHDRRFVERCPARRRRRRRRLRRSRGSGTPMTADSATPGSASIRSSISFG